jgi:16S rRNA G966 N2-methylase RsmD
MIEEFDNPTSSSSDYIIVESTKKGYILKDKKTMMTFLLDLEEYEKIVKQRNNHILKKVFKRKDLNILDCTGGFARDSAIISSLGNTVTLIENNPVIMMVLKDAISRINSTTMNNIFNKITTKFGDCIDFIRTTSKKYDYIYFDFMFNINKTALPLKKDQFIRKIVQNNAQRNQIIIDEVLHRVGCKVIIKEHAKTNDYKHLDIINTYKEKIVKYHLLEGKNENY